VPLATDLVPGELAINLADRKLYTKDTSGVVFNLLESVTSAATELQIQALQTSDETLSNSLNTLSGAVTALSALVEGVITGNTSFSIHAPDDHGVVGASSTFSQDFGLLAEPVTAVEDYGVI
jgi:hypothetical protein